MAVPRHIDDQIKIEISTMIDNYIQSLATTNVAKKVFAKINAPYGRTLATDAELSDYETAINEYVEGLMM